MPRAARTAIIAARESMRFPTAFPGFVEANSHINTVTIDDLSENGAHILTSRQLLVGSCVMLIARDIRVRATVVRSTRRGYGLRLAESILPLRVVRANIVARMFGKIEPLHVYRHLDATIEAAF